MTKRLGQLVDVAAVREEARAAWEQDQQAKMSVQERIGGSVPWWLVIIAATLFALSVPHTMAVFAQITPYFGYVAPFGIEFGLLYYAFRTKQEKGRESGAPWSLHLLGVLFFVTSIIVNGAGSLQAVVSAYEETKGMPISDLVGQFSTLPATSQIALLLVPVAALFIPIGTMAAGEGLANLFLERDEQNDMLSARWERVRIGIEFEALRDEALRAGATATQAQRWAETVAGVGKTVAADRPQVSAGVRSGQTDSEPDAFTDAATEDDGQDRGHGHGQGYTRTTDARSRVLDHLADNPADANLSVRTLAELAGVGKTVAAEVLSEFKSSRNGHGNHSDEN